MYSKKEKSSWQKGRVSNKIKKKEKANKHTKTNQGGAMKESTKAETTDTVERLSNNRKK